MERFMELYDTVYRDLYRLAYYYLGNPQDAEDAVGETVLRAYEKFTSLRQTEAFRAWIFRILINQCKSQLRKRKKRDFEELKEEPAYEPELGAGDAVTELLSFLSEEERQIVVLAVFGGYKGVEIAQMLHRRHSTIRSKYRRALKKLEQRLSTEEVQNEAQ